MIIGEVPEGFYDDGCRFFVENLHLSFTYDTLEVMAEWFTTHPNIDAVMKLWTGTIRFGSEADRTMFLLRWPADLHHSS